MKNTDVWIWRLVFIAIGFMFLWMLFGCVTIKYTPPPCKKDTVYIIEKESPLKFQPMPHYPYPFDQGINPLIPWLDTSKAGIKLTQIIDTLYKVKALKAQQMTNQ